MLQQYTRKQYGVSELKQTKILKKQRHLEPIKIKKSLNL